MCCVGMLFFRDATAGGLCFFFFQAEDGIRDGRVTGVQTCALPILGTRILRGRPLRPEDRAGAPNVAVVSQSMARTLWPGEDAIGKCFRMRVDSAPCMRSEERRVGKECRSRWWPDK